MCARPGIDSLYYSLEKVREEDNVELVRCASRNIYRIP
jgi:hypothetical protein